MVVAGNYDEKIAKENIEKYFSEIPKTDISPGLKPKDLKITDTKVIRREENVQLERIYLAWASDNAFGNDDASLDILADLLSGSKNARLYKKIVFEKELAQDISAFHYSGKISGHFIIIATAKKGKSIDEIKSDILNELEAIKNAGPSDRELTKTKNRIRSGFVFSLQNLDTMANQLNYYNFFLGEPNSFQYDLDRYNDVSSEKVKAVIEKYLLKPFIELKIVPKSQ
jgi:zinc protease